MVKGRNGPVFGGLIHSKANALPFTLTGKPPGWYTDAGHCLCPWCHQEDNVQWIHGSFLWTESLSKRRSLPFACNILYSQWQTHSEMDLTFPFPVTNCNSCFYGKHQPSVSLRDFNLKTPLGFSQLRLIGAQMGWDKECFPLWLLEVVLPLAQ